MNSVLWHPRLQYYALLELSQSTNDGVQRTDTVGMSELEVRFRVLRACETQGACMRPHGREAFRSRMSACNANGLEKGRKKIFGLEKVDQMPRYRSSMLLREVVKLSCQYNLTRLKAKDVYGPGHQKRSSIFQVQDADG